MLATKIYKDEWEVQSRLAHFGVTQQELMEIAVMTLGARADSVPDDPCTAAGLLSYIFGTRYLRQLFRSRGWVKDSTSNIESVINLETGDRIIYQNVDHAGLAYTSPRAISSKGKASTDMVDTAQGRLFADAEIPEVVSLARIRSINSRVWYFCVAFSDDHVIAELSLPATVTAGNFNGFLERIFIGDSRRPEPTKVGGGGEPPIEFEPVIVRK